MNNITIIQHNVNTFTNKKFNLINTYRQINPDIILLNHTALKNNTPLHIQGYMTYTKNTQNLTNRGTAIAIKQCLAHKIIDDFTTDLIAIDLETDLGTITIATDYVTPNAPYLDLVDYNSLINRRNPV